MRAFVVRPFGRAGDVNYDEVHTELIGPALKAVGLEGGTSALIVDAGNVREDMFRELVLADVVVADVSIHNANVFYELGIRHAVKSRATILIRARIAEIPFDLRTDRYLVYDATEPGASLDALVQMLRETMAGERMDSPVFQLLPGFRPSDQSGLLDLPRDLHEQIEAADQNRRCGDLRLYAEEVTGLRFEEAALRAIGAALTRLGDDRGAQRVWERVRSTRRADLEANQALSNVYRRLGLLVESDQAIARALQSAASLSPLSRAELHALRGSNAKRRWVRRWRTAGSPEERQRTALASKLLDDSLEAYRGGFTESLNHWYSGLNALALTTMLVCLAERWPDDWRLRHGDDDEAEAALARARQEQQSLSTAVRASLDAARSRLTRQGTVDPWCDVSVADYRSLTASEPLRVAAAYKWALSALDSSAQASVREQLELLRDLDVCRANADAALEVLTAEQETDHKIRAVVFRGHMIDGPDRPVRRFPPEMAPLVAARIREALDAMASTAEGCEVVGMASAADGGDLIFLEECRHLGLQTWVFLPVPEASFRITALARSDGSWAPRYYAALESASMVLTLSDIDSLPGWLQTQPGYSTWPRSNLWMLHHAFADSDRVTVLALWNGEPSDGPGGVSDMVRAAKQMGADIRIIQTEKLLEVMDAASEVRVGSPQ
jgi:hypothetical protein